jgi:hemoglobin
LQAPNVRVFDDGGATVLVVARDSVYEAVGGDAAFLALSEALHRRCLEDPVLNHPFSHALDPAHDEHLAAYLGEVFGGPATYTAALGGESAMLARHAGTGADEDFPARFVACFDAAVVDVGLGERPEVARVLHDYMVWAAGEVQAVSPLGTRVADGLGVPRWSWDGLVEG